MEQARQIHPSSWLQVGNFHKKVASYDVLYANMWTLQDEWNMIVDV